MTNRETHHRYIEARTSDGRPINWCEQCKLSLEHPVHIMHHWDLRLIRSRHQWRARHPTGISFYAASWQGARDMANEYRMNFFGTTPEREKWVIRKVLWKAKEPWFSYHPERKIVHHATWWEAIARFEQERIAHEITRNLRIERQSRGVLG